MTADPMLAALADYMLRPIVDADPDEETADDD